MIDATPCRRHRVTGCDSCEWRERAEKAESMLREMLKSACPHPVAHPTMWRAWRRAEELLGIPVEKSHAIQTADKKLEAKLLEAGNE